MKPLLIRKLVIKLEETETKKAEFIARELPKVPIESNESTFETMLGDWKDFVGFVEFSGSFNPKKEFYRYFV